MRGAQALDFGLNIAGAILLMIPLLLGGQAAVLGEERPDPLVVAVEVPEQGPAVLRSRVFSGSLGEVRGALVRACSVPSPPWIRLVFDGDTRLGRARKIRQTLERMPDVACPVGGL